MHPRGGNFSKPMEMTMDQVILVDEQDQEIGLADKLEAHQQGKLHRAFSVFVFNSKGEWLLQQRAFDKYHSGGLWTNSCCSHPKPQESLDDATARRLQEEMGMSCKVEHQFSFIYKAVLDNELTEYELDHIFIGITDELPKPNPEEVYDYCYERTEVIENQLNEFPDNFTIWFQHLFPKVKALLEERGMEV